MTSVAPILHGATYLTWKGYDMKEIPQWIAMVMISVIGALAVMDRGHVVNAINDLKAETKSYRAEAKEANEKQDVQIEKILDIVRNQNHVIKTVCGLISIPYGEREKFLKTMSEFNGNKK